MKKLLLILILHVSLLFSPPPETGKTDPNVRYVSINRYAGFFLNPDTYGFIFPAIKPGLLIINRSQRQSRPLFILTGSAIGYSINFLTWPIRQQITNFYRKFWRGTYSEKQILLIGDFYLGYLLVNLLILWIALYLFEKIFFDSRNAGPKGRNCYKYFPMIFIASNPVTKAFFWTVHQQMFALLTPILCVYILYRFYRITVAVSYMKMLGFFLAAGLLLLMYGNFILLLPVLLICFIRNLKEYKSFKQWPGALMKASGLIMAFFLPTILWIGILKGYGVSYYNFEMQEYHQVIWIPEALNHSVSLFLTQLRENTLEYFQTMRQLLILMFFSLIIFAYSKFDIPWGNRFLRGVLFIIFYFFLFYWLLGFYEARLTNTLIPLIVCFWLAGLQQRIREKKMIFILSSLALVWHSYVLFSYGPFS